MKPNLSKLRSTLENTPKGNLMSNSEALAEKKKFDDLSTFTCEYIPFEQLVPMEYNRQIYDVDHLEFIGSTITTFGLLDTLCVQKIAGEEKYRIVSGERRYQSIKLEKEKAEKEGKKYPLFVRGIPCRVFPEDMPLTKIKMILLIANATVRNKDSKTQLIEIKALVEQFNQAEEEGLSFGISLKELLINELNIKERQYQKYMAALKMLPDLQTLLEQGKITMDQSSIIGSKPAEVQEQILEFYNDGMSIEDAIQIVNKSYKEYKTIIHDQENQIRQLKEELSSVKDAVAQSDDPSEMDKLKEKILSLTKELDELRQKKTNTKKNIKHYIKNKTKQETTPAAKEIATSEKERDSFTTNLTAALKYAEADVSSIMIAITKVPADDTTIKKIKDLITRLNNILAIAQNQSDSDSDSFPV